MYNPHVHCGLWVTMMCQCGVNYNRCSRLLGDVGNGGGCVCVEPERIWEICPLHSILREPKTIPKIKLY